MKCPNCDTGMEKLSETEFFCETDNMTVIIKDGKAKAQLGKGRLQGIEEAIAVLQKEQQDIKDDLYGDSALPFI